MKSDEMIRESEWTKDDLILIACQCAIDTFEQHRKDAENLADHEAMEHYWRLNEIYRQLRAELNDPGVLPLEEILGTSGSGWAESWVEPDDVIGLEEEFELIPCAWCRGNVIYQDGDSTDKRYLSRIYNRKYGMRIWRAQPDDAQREAAPWDIGQEERDNDRA